MNGTVLTQNESFLKKAYQAALVSGILSTLSSCANILADGVLVGQKIGADGLAAINYCVPVYLALCIAGSFVVSGGAICASRETGRGKDAEAARFYREALTLCILCSFLFASAGVFFTGPVSYFICRDSQVLPMVVEYNRVTLIGAFPKILIYMPFWFLRLDGKNKSLTLTMFLMAGGNIVLDVLFLNIFSMGVSGAALASVVSTAAACVYGFIQQEKGESVFHVGLALPGRAHLREIAAAGSPAAVNNAFQTVRLLCINSLLHKYGGSVLVAEFTVINGISAFAEAVTVGVPQASTAIMGVCSGEHDNRSMSLLLRLESRKGFFCSLVFGFCIVTGSGLIGKAYGMEISMAVPMFCLAISMFPALWNNLLTCYYNVSGYAWLADLMIFLRVFLFSVAALALFLSRGWTAWYFLAAAEVLTIVFWFAITGFLSRRSGKSRFFLMNPSMEDEGTAVSFSTVGDTVKICEVSEKITGFCRERGMEPKKVNRVSLALEEIMTLITDVNPSETIFFDLRVFVSEKETGIRIRYNGRNYNPLLAAGDGGDLYMGIRLIEKMMEEMEYQSTFGMNTLLIFL